MVHFCHVSPFFRALPYCQAQQHVSGIFSTFSRQPWFLSMWKWYLESMIWELGVIIAFWVSLCLGLSADRAGERCMGFTVAVNTDVSLQSDVTGFLLSSLIHQFSFSPGPQRQCVYSFVEFCKHKIVSELLHSCPRKHQTYQVESQDLLAVLFVSRLRISCQSTEFQGNWLSFPVLTHLKYS